MAATLVDSNVLIDVLARDSAWTEWSDQALIWAGDAGAVFVNQVIYAEISVGFATVEECEWAVEADMDAHLSSPNHQGPAEGGPSS